MIISDLNHLEVVSETDVIGGVLAPSCVDVNVLGTGTDAVVTNNCSTTERVKVVWAFGGDSACTTLRPGYQFDDSAGFTARFDRLESC